MKFTMLLCAPLLCAMTMGAGSVQGATADEAAQLKSSLTPLGAERKGNKDGTIPAWDGGLKDAGSFALGGRRPDPFAADKKLYSITAKNAGEYADKLSDGVKALFAKYPDSYRIDVYPTRRSDSAPQWVYDNTFKNATQATIGKNLVVEGAYGGIPFPIPKSGAEVMWNSQLRWRGEAWRTQQQAFLGTADGKTVETVDASFEQQMPYYFKDGSPDKFNGEYMLNRLVNSGPPIRAGEAIVGRVNVDDDKSRVWVYITGQRRVRKLPNACCDTPSPAAAGVMSFDEINVFFGRLDRFDWKLVGKKEMLIPYNANKALQPRKSAEVVGPHFLNPDHVRWELHRVWVVEATLAPGARHSAQRSVYYVDEDSWISVLGDRYDAKGQLWKTLFQLPIAAPDLPGTISGPFGFVDLLSSTWFVGLIWNEKNEQLKYMPRFPDTNFTPDAMAGEGIR
jgi:hypothetical protein